jgi:hypothetical protein
LGRFWACSPPGAIIAGDAKASTSTVSMRFARAEKRVLLADRKTGFMML